MPSNKSGSSLRSTLRGKQAMFASWLATDPFITSFVEDERRGTAKETRNNTLRNRENSSFPPSPKSAALSSCPTETDASVSSSQSLDSLPNTPPTPTRKISFSTKVKVYSSENPKSPVEEDVKEPSMQPPLEVRRQKRARSVPVADIHEPTTAAGRWLLRRASISIAHLDRES